MSTAFDTSSVLDALNRELGDGGVVTDGAELRFYSMDLMWSGPVATAVARPRSVAQVVALTRIAAAHGVALVPRGGGMSYTMGYVPQHARSVIVDLTALDRIVEINETDMYVTAEAGCSWKVLYEALAARGLRTPYFGPVSGVHATVGGAVSQGSMFFGSGTYGPVAESVLSVRTVLGNGSVIKTGARANRGDVPFNRYYGPDLTGLFLSDTGAMGIKVEVSIRLMRMPKGLACASYGFERFEDLYEAQAEIARHRIVAECFALDPFLGGKRTNLQSWTEGVRTLADVAKARGLADAVKVARGAAVEIAAWGGDRPLPGKVRLVEPLGFRKISALGVEEQRVRVIIDLTGPRESWQRLGHGYRVGVKIARWSDAKVLQVPIGALFREGTGWAAFTVDSDGRARRIAVAVGQMNDETAQVLGGLREGQAVIVHPGEKVRDGVRVTAAD